jgi:predicted acyltransferase
MKQQRYYSLDVFRGATVALMILVNNPGSWGHIFSPLAHASWHGCTPTDLVFPFFLFAVGNALSFVMPKMQNETDAYFWKKVVKRTLLIFLIGLFINWSPFVKWADGALVFKAWENVRILGVLQRIALCYFFASVIIYYGKTKMAFLIGILILIIYWVLNFTLGAPGHPYSLSGFFGNEIDISLLGVTHIYKGEGVPFDPEGLVSMFPAIVQVIFGYLVGEYIQVKGKSYEMLAQLLLTGIILVLAPYIWDFSFPINKKIWTSSYVLYTSGLATITLSILIYLLEFKNTKGAWSKFFDVFGKNPLFIFFMSGFLPRVIALFRWVDHVDEKGENVYTSALPWFYQHVCKDISSDLRIGSFIYAICFITFFALLAYVLDKKKIYIKV